MASDEHNSYSYALTADPGKPLREAKETIVNLTGDVEMLNGIIKGLRHMVDDAQSSRAQLEKDFNAALEELHQHNELLKKVVDALTRMREQRDEARRNVCLWHESYTGGKPEDYATHHGWDCYQDRGMDCLKGDGK